MNFNLRKLFAICLTFLVFFSLSSMVFARGVPTVYYIQGELNPTASMPESPAGGYDIHFGISDPDGGSTQLYQNLNINTRSDLQNILENGFFSRATIPDATEQWSCSPEENTITLKLDIRSAFCSPSGNCFSPSIEVPNPHCSGIIAANSLDAEGVGEMAAPSTLDIDPTVYEMVDAGTKYLTYRSTDDDTQYYIPLQIANDWLDLEIDGYVTSDEVCYYYDPVTGRCESWIDVLEFYGVINSGNGSYDYCYTTSSGGTPSNCTPNTTTTDTDIYLAGGYGSTADAVRFTVKDNTTNEEKSTVIEFP